MIQLNEINLSSAMCSKEFVPNTHHLVGTSFLYVYKVKTDAEIRREAKQLLLWHTSFGVAIFVVILRVVIFFAMARRIGKNENYFGR